MKWEGIMRFFTCPECRQTFDLFEDGDEVMFGHDCEESE